MKLYWIYRKDDGDLELRSFHGAVRGNDRQRFHDSPRAAIESYRQNLMRQEVSNGKALRKIGEDTARLWGLEEELEARANDDSETR